MHKKLSIVISCIDYRFWPRALPLIKRKYGDFDLVEIAGGSKNLSSPHHKGDKHTVLENIRTSIKLHNTKTLILTNHQDCGAYGGSKRFDSFAQEFGFHKKELRRAKRIAHHHFPRLKIKTFFLARDNKNKIRLL